MERGRGDFRTPQRQSRAKALVALLTLFIFILGTEEALAKKSGGRMGGSAGFSRSRSSSGFRSLSSSRPSGRISGSPGRGYGSTGPSRTPFFFDLPYLGGPRVAYGSFFRGGLFTFLLLGTAVGLLAYVAVLEWRRVHQAGREGGRQRALMANTVGKLQLALLFTARSVQQELEDLALKSRTDTPQGLAELLQAVTVAISRHPEYWRYGLWEVHRAGSLDDAEERFREVVAEERGKLSRESLISVDGTIQHRTLTASEEEVLQEAGGFIVMTVIVAVKRRAFDTIPKPTQEDIQRILKKLGGIIGPHLLGVEVIWTPQTPGEVLSGEELLVEYPNLNLL